MVKLNLIFCDSRYLPYIKRKKKKSPTSVKTHVTIVLHVNDTVEEKPIAHLLSGTDITMTG